MENVDKTYNKVMGMEGQTPFGMGDIESKIDNGGSLDDETPNVLMDTKFNGLLSIGGSKKKSSKMVKSKNNFNNMSSMLNLGKTNSNFNVDKYLGTSSKKIKGSFNPDNFLSMSSKKTKGGFNPSNFLSMSSKKTNGNFNVGKFIGGVKSKNDSFNVGKFIGGVKNTEGNFDISKIIGGSNTEKQGWNRMNMQNNLSMFGDFDRDGTQNIFDCNPFDKTKQAKIHSMARDKNLEVYSVEPEQTNDNYVELKPRGRITARQPQQLQQPMEEEPIIPENVPEVGYDDIPTSGKQKQPQMEMVQEWTSKEEIPSTEVGYVNKPTIRSKIGNTITGWGKETLSGLGLVKSDKRKQIEKQGKEMQSEVIKLAQAEAIKEITKAETKSQYNTRLKREIERRERMRDTNAFTRGIDSLNKGTRGAAGSILGGLGAGNPLNQEAFSMALGERRGVAPMELVPSSSTSFQDKVNLSVGGNKFSGNMEEQEPQQTYRQQEPQQTYRQPEQQTHRQPAPQQTYRQPARQQGPDTPPPQPGMVWSEASSKWVTYTRGRYNKNSYPQQQQY